MPLEYMGLGTTLASADTRAYNRKKTLYSLLELGLLRTAQAGEERGNRAGHVSCACPILAWQGGRGVHSGSVLSHLMPGVAGLVQRASPQALLCPPPTAAQARPATEAGQVCPRKYKGPCQAPLVFGETAAQSSGKWWLAKSRNQNYTKGKTGRAQEIKTKEKSCI